MILFIKNCECCTHFFYLHSCATAAQLRKRSKPLCGDHRSAYSFASTLTHTCSTLISQSWDYESVREQQSMNGSEFRLMRVWMSVSDSLSVWTWLIQQVWVGVSMWVSACKCEWKWLWMCVSEYPLILPAYDHYVMMYAPLGYHNRNWFTETSTLILKLF